VFEQGPLENLDPMDLKAFIRKRCNEKLMELGYEATFTYDTASAKRLDWFYNLTGGVTHTDFFAIRPTDYSKAGSDEDFESVWE
jgi:ribonucleoside-diphosphate reductase beta chain